jgi:Domain of unknown function (DUF5666)
MRTLRSRALRSLVFLAVVAAAGACASGGGISGTSIVIGPVTDFGSILVNGIELDTTGAEVTIEGDPASIEDLRLGMFVFVRGQVNEKRNTGVAERIASDHLIEGPVDAVNAAGATFSVLRQLVIIDANTVFDQTTLATLAPDDLVEVWGVTDADASIRATRVEKESAVPELELTGVVTGLDDVAQTFRIGILTIDYSSALLENIPAGGLADGLVVEVEIDGAPAGDAAVASNVEVRDARVVFAPGDGARVQGFITSVVSAAEIVVNTTQHVVLTPDTRFERGTADDLALNSQLDVSGEFDDGGATVAAEIEFLAAATP